MDMGTDLVVAPPKVSDSLPKHLRARLFGCDEVFKVPLRHVLRLCRMRRLLYFGCSLIIISVTELKVVILLCICLNAGGRFRRLLFLGLFEQPVANEILAASCFHRYTILLWRWARDRRRRRLRALAREELRVVPWQWFRRLCAGCSGSGEGGFLVDVARLE